ncbi:PREDICTED: neurotrimin-like, partial [Diuraphis noxia]|uniref:neurotrimin-like n=1 Tax=Diuraphis noxia TaxID=143948 RepID=UPI0007639CAE
VQKDGPEPEFLNPMENVTVALGREAILVCSVKNIGEHKVGWLKAEDQTILSLHERVVTENRRIDIDVDNNTYWRLKIRQLQRSDKGCYMCQINTHVMKKQIGCVDVKVDRVRGEPLLLNKVDRSQMGHYLCIASNDVPPAVSKRITLNVNFSPVVWVTNQIVSAPLNTHVRLECFVESFPNSVNYWSDDKGEMIRQGPKYFIEEVKTNYKVNMYLNIQNLDKNDLGTYRCLATNSMGHANSSVRVHKIILPTTTVAPTTSTTTTVSTTTTTTTLPSTTRIVTISTVIPSPTTKRKIHTKSGDRKSGGKMDDKTGLRMNGVESADEMETKSSSHRASRGSSRVRRSTISQSVSIAAELAFLAAATASWSTGFPVDAAIGGLVSLMLVVSPSLIMWLQN